MIALLLQISTLFNLAIFSSSISALRYGTDSDENDITVQYQTETSKSFLVMKTTFQYINSNFVMCFKELSISASSTDNTRCILSDAVSGYKCLQYSYASSGVSYYYYELSDDYSVMTNLQAYTPASVVSGTAYGTYSISLSGTIGTNTSVNYLSNNRTVYSVRSNNARTFYGSTTIKENYLTTICMNLSLRSENMLLQRHVQCFLYNNDIATGIFYGGVYRFSKPIMMFAITTISSNATYFAGWAGISFSENHAFRDMVGLIHHSGTITDLKSLVAGAPYADSSTNIGGVQSYTRLSSTSIQNRNQISTSYQTQFYREYYTGDSYGDEDLIYKMNNKYCVATSVTTFSSVNSMTTYSGSPTDSSYQHQTYGCFLPDLTLRSSVMKFSLAFVAILMVFIS